MFQFVVLVEGSLRTVGLSAGLDCAFVESLDLVCVSSESFRLLIPLKGAVALLVLK